MRGHAKKGVGIRENAKARAGDGASMRREEGVPGPPARWVPPNAGLRGRDGHAGGGGERADAGLEGEVLDGRGARGRAAARARVLRAGVVRVEVGRELGAAARVEREGKERVGEERQAGARRVLGLVLEERLGEPLAEAGLAEGVSAG
jgi:hypothetical protein